MVPLVFGSRVAPWWRAFAGPVLRCGMHGRGTVFAVIVGRVIGLGVIVAREAFVALQLSSGCVASSRRRFRQAASVFSDARG